MVVFRILCLPFVPIVAVLRFKKKKLPYIPYTPGTRKAEQCLCFLKMFLLQLNQ